ncbi:MAG: hypothetical protein DWQ07_03170 [Chloroflexi bacterium]|nr:MAG: hypothetical protein DWQ07_03170 [Chloroflexota bacterium]MBL1193498.1 hypothetical protein [Chloroflexota bacterium]NOH10789.1 hypothetical protein [Chloroflexota bacterium]
MAELKSSPAYQAAQQNAVYIPRPNVGYLEVHSEDRVDFLQRQTTNDLGLLMPNRAVNNVLTSATARILEIFLMLDRDEHIALLVPPGRVDSTEVFLKSHIFFMDKVEVHNHSDDWSQIEVHGPEAVDRFGELGITQVPGLDEVIETELAGNAVSIIGIQGLTSELSYLLLTSKHSENTILGALQNAGFKELEQDDYQVLRIEAGQPAMGHELTPNYTPLESGLAHWVSDTKGCYTGQEVIARQITYDKVTKNLIQLRLEQMVELGAKVLVDGKTAGSITSIAISMKLGPIALAVLKRPHNAPGTAVEVEKGEERVSGSIAILKGQTQNT